MKQFLKRALLVALAAIMLLGLVSCGSRNVDTDAYSVELPSGYRKSRMLSDDETQIYDKGFFSSSGNMISITYWNYDDVKTICRGSGIENPTDEQMKHVLYETYTSAAGYTKQGTVTVGNYTLYQYDDLFDSTAAYYIYLGEKVIWTIDFSIDDAEYEAFKENIPPVLASFKEK